jgi:hypothetical protein
LTDGEVVSIGVIESESRDKSRFGDGLVKLHENKNKLDKTSIVKDGIIFFMCLL